MLLCIYSSGYKNLDKMLRMRVVFACENVRLTKFESIFICITKSFICICSPHDPTIPLVWLCKYIIYTIYVQDLLGHGGEQYAARRLMSRNENKKTGPTLYEPRIKVSKCA